MATSENSTNKVEAVVRRAQLIYCIMP